MSAIELDYRRLFSALDEDQDGFITREALVSRLQMAGFDERDPRLSEIFARTAAADRLDVESFMRLIQARGNLVKDACLGRLVIPDFQEIRAEFQGIFSNLKENREGKVASYIPQLSRVNPDLFAVSACTIDGQRFHLGDHQVNFCVQSVMKPINYCIALEENGEAGTHRWIGREPSGRGFNELTLNKEGRPHNPLINSGAIVACSMIRSQYESAERFASVLKTWGRLAGGEYVGFNNASYLSERETADRNFALGYFMRENACFPQGTDLLQTLEFYFQCCSIEANAESLGMIAASLANGGVCPLTGERVFAARTVQNCLSLMSSCGMYDFSGEFAFSIGLPAKSGVSGALMVVVPQVMGIALYSPPLDPIGNSVRGIAFCRELVARYNFHMFDSVTQEENRKRDPRRRRRDTQIEGTVRLCWAASIGDLTEVQRLAAAGVDLNAADYDGRTALHLAASEGQTEVIEYLLLHQVSLQPVDRWGGTPLSDAQRAGHTAAVRIFESHGQLANDFNKGATTDKNVARASEM